jgi:hypothetical protein
MEYGFVDHVVTQATSVAGGGGTGGATKGSGSGSAKG